MTILTISQSDIGIAHKVLQGVEKMFSTKTSAEKMYRNCMKLVRDIKYDVGFLNKVKHIERDVLKDRGIKKIFSCTWINFLRKTMATGGR